VTVLKETIIQNRISSISSVVAMASAVALLIAFNTPSQVSAQLTPSITSDPPDTGIEFIGQNSTNPVQNSTSANITQLATLPATGSPITPASFAPASEVSEDSSDDNDNGDDGNDNDNDNGDDGNDNDNDNGDDGNDNDSGGGSSSSASAGGGRASASAG
jgi:hypothetical protein